VDWLVEDGKNTPCCLLAGVTADDIKSRPEHFDCATCERRRRWLDLWPENRTAWDCYQDVARRTVRDTQAGAWILSTFTAGWSWPRIAQLLARLDLIVEIVAPAPTPGSHGRRTSA
jgi:hypothetical protein